MSNKYKMKEFKNKIQLKWFKKCKWQRIVIVKPDEAVRIIQIPYKGAYITYNAYFPELGKDREFEFTLPFYPFKRWIDGIAVRDRQITGKDVEFELYCSKHGKIKFRGFKIL